MKKFLTAGAFFLITGLVAGVVRGEPMSPVVSSNTTASAVSSSAAAPTASSETVSVVMDSSMTTVTNSSATDSDVTVSTQPLREMTKRPLGGMFYTLTRNPYPVAQLPTDAEVVTPGQFTALDAQNAGDLLSQKTSFRTLPIGGVGTPLPAGIRGANPNETLILIDGRPASGVAFGATDLAEIPTEMIDHIEVLRGGASALYGPNAVGGVVNVITKRAIYVGQPISHVSYDDGGFYGRQTYRLDFGSRYGPVDYFFFGDQAAVSGYPDNTDDRSHNIGGNIGYSMGKGGKLVFDVSSYNKNAGVSGSQCGANDPFCLTTPAAARQITDNNYIRSSYILPLPHDTLMTLRLFGSQKELQFDDPNDPNPLDASLTDRLEQSHGGELQYTLPLGLTVGGTFIHDREDNTDLLTPANSFVHWSENYGFFAQDEFHYERFTLIPSGRYDHNSLTGETKNPRVQALVDATDWLRFSGSSGRSFRAPTFDELYLNTSGAFPFTANPNLKPETAWTYDSGFELHEDSMSFRATYFRADVSNLIQTLPTDPSNVNAPFEAVNVGRARRQGAEIQLDHTVNSYFKDSWNYTYLRNVGMLAGSDQWATLAFSPKHTLNYLATITPSKKWKIDSTFRYEDSRFSGNDNTGIKLGSQLITDLRVSYQLLQMEIYLGVNDVTDKRYEEQPGFVLPGHTIYGGLNLKLWG